MITTFQLFCFLCVFSWSSQISVWLFSWVLHISHVRAKEKTWRFLLNTVSSASLSTDNIAVNLEPRDCSHQNGGDDHIWNLYKIPFSEANPPPRWKPIHHGLESFRWNKDVTVTIVYKMRVNIVALYQRAFYSREDYNKDRIGLSNKGRVLIVQNSPFIMLCAICYSLYIACSNSSAVVTTVVAPAAYSSSA